MPARRRRSITHSLEADAEQLLRLDGRTSNYTLWAGFTGLSQDEKTLALRPEIGWFITEQD